MNNWRKGIASWTVRHALYLSIPFTYLLPQAREMAEQHAGPVIVGGPAVSLMPDYLADVAQIGGEPIVRPLDYHNPLATFTSRGCVNNCPFCAVPKIEGDLKELDEWPVRPIVCDNNLIACSKRHFDRVIDRLKCLPYVDFNQGLDARRFTSYHASRMAELKHVKVRFSFDFIEVESAVYEAINTARKAGLKDVSVYVLIGFNDSTEQSLYRLEKVREWGIRPNPMPFEPLDSLRKGSFLAPGWTMAEKRRMARYYSRLRWLEHIPYTEYKPEGELPLFNVVTA